MGAKDWFLAAVVFVCVAYVTGDVLATALVSGLYLFGHTK